MFLQLSILYLSRIIKNNVEIKDLFNDVESLSAPRQIGYVADIAGEHGKRMFGGRIWLIGTQWGSIARSVGGWRCVQYMKNTKSPLVMFRSCARNRKRAITDNFEWQYMTTAVYNAPTFLPRNGVVKRGIRYTVYLSVCFPHGRPIHRIHWHTIYSFQFPFNWNMFLNSWR